VMMMTMIIIMMTSQQLHKAQGLGLTLYANRHLWFPQPAAAPCS
jgi:hypothetical protein